MRRAAVAAALFLWGFALLPGRAEADGPSPVGPWGTDSALTMPRGRWELGLFHPSRWAPADRLEIALHPLLFFVLPHVEAKMALLERGAFHFGARARLSYPTLFLSVVSKEGSGGLL